MTSVYRSFTSTIVANCSPANNFLLLYYDYYYASILEGLGVGRGKQINEARNIINDILTIAYRP
jgi:hypothetical protein